MDVPWLVLINATLPSGHASGAQGYKLCSGFILSRQYIATSALCTTTNSHLPLNASHFAVTTGDGKKHRLEAVYRSPLYATVRDDALNDFAILKVQKCLYFSCTHFCSCKNLSRL